MKWLSRLGVKTGRPLFGADSTGSVLTLSLACRSLSIEPSSYTLVVNPICRSVRRSVRKVYCGKTADWIWLPFGVASGVGRGTSVLDGSRDHRRGRGSFEGKCGT